jgi:hypothetical protein
MLKTFCERLFFDFTENEKPRMNIDNLSGVRSSCSIQVALSKLAKLVLHPLRSRNFAIFPFVKCAKHQ